MRKYFIIIAGIWLALILVTGASCSSGTKVSNSSATNANTATSTASQNIQDISVADAYQLIQENKDNPDFIIIDVRTPEEYAAGHIENAKLINFYDSNFKDELNPLDRTKTYFIYCRTGHRSGLARDMMKEMGFEHVINMLGGITDWTAQDYPVVKG